VNHCSEAGSGQIYVRDWASSDVNRGAQGQAAAEAGGPAIGPDADLCGRFP
jgi:hypothetical protein